MNTEISNIIALTADAINGRLAEYTDGDDGYNITMKETAKAFILEFVDGVELAYEFSDRLPRGSFRIRNDRKQPWKAILTIKK